MSMTLILMTLAGAGMGAAIGHFGKCSSGVCVLTATWRRGALFGALVGAVLFFTSARNGDPAMNESGANVARVGEGEFAAQVEQAALPVMVDFYATWCGPCKMLAPQLEELAGQFTNRVKFVKVNVDEAAALARRFEVRAIPTLVVFKDGKEADRLVGLPSVSELQAWLEELVSTNATASGAL
jgi:thioredoxin 2